MSRGKKNMNFAYRLENESNAKQNDDLNIIPMDIGMLWTLI